ASRVTGRIQKIQVSYNFQPVRKGQLLLEIYSPDLAAAQQELLFLTGKDNPSMLEKAKRRLNLLGMENAQINEVIRSGKIMYNIPVYSTRSGFILQATTNGSVKPEGPGSAQ